MVTAVVWCPMAFAFIDLTGRLNASSLLVYRIIGNMRGVALDFEIG